MLDQLWCGDAVYEYRFSNEVIEVLHQREALYVLGNHESVLLSQAGIRAREAPDVRRGNLEYMASRTSTIDLVIGGKRLIMTHASPVAPYNQYVYPQSSELKELRNIDADYVILGHTHVQMVERLGRCLVINPGSAGEARDRANGRRLSCAIVDTSSDEVLIDNFAVGDAATADFVSTSV